MFSYKKNGARSSILYILGHPEDNQTTLLIHRRLFAQTYTPLKIFNVLDNYILSLDSDFVNI